MKTIKTLCVAAMFCCTLAICGCGETPGTGHAEDATPGGQPSVDVGESMDPDAIQDKMGGDYAKEAKKSGQ